MEKLKKNVELFGKPERPVIEETICSAKLKPGKKYKIFADLYLGNLMIQILDENKKCIESIYRAVEGMKRTVQLDTEEIEYNPGLVAKLKRHTAGTKFKGGKVVKLKFT